MSLCALERPIPESMSIKSQRCDEDVDEDDEEDEQGRCVVQSVQFSVFPHVVKIVLHC